MADLEEEVKVLKQQNTELVQRVQHLKMLAAQREMEKIELMKELNDMRLKLSRLRSNGSVQASKLDTALQSASQKALTHLVRASGEIARTIDLAKTYMNEQKKLEAASPRWSSIGGTPKTEKVCHRVPPMMMGGRSIQPVVSLSRTLLNTSNTRPAPTSPNQNRNVTERAVPMHMLQDVYIPLTRIDASELQSTNMDTEMDAENSDDSAEELGLNSSGEGQMEDSQRMSNDENYNYSRKLDAVAEDNETELEGETPPGTSRQDNPLEGPSWLLDAPTTSTKPSKQTRRNLEPDSTTEVEESAAGAGPQGVEASGRASSEFSPTVRRRKRTSSPPPAPRPAPAAPAPATPRRAAHHPSRAPPHRRNSNCGRVLKVMVSKMRLDSLSPGSPACKRAATELSLMDAPSPNGATVAGVIVSETPLNHSGAGEPHVTHRRPSQSQERRAIQSQEPPASRPKRSHDTRGPNQSQDTCGSSQSQDTFGSSQSQGTNASLSESHDRDRNMDESETRVKQERDSRGSRATRHNSSSRQDSRYDSDSGSGGDPGEGRTRRARKPVSYQEKPLNRKMRR